MKGPAPFTRTQACTKRSPDGARQAGWPGTFSHRSVSFHSLLAAMADQLSLEQRLAKEATAALSKEFFFPGGSALTSLWPSFTASAFLHLPAIPNRVIARIIVT